MLIAKWTNPNLYLTVLTMANKEEREAFFESIKSLETGDDNDFQVFAVKHVRLLSLFAISHTYVCVVGVRRHLRSKLMYMSVCAACVARKVGQFQL